METAVSITVVSAVIIRKGRVLLTQRDPSRSDYGLFWESPGGKVEPNEPEADAVLREVREELGVEQAEIVEHLATFDFDPDTNCEIVRPCTVHFYLVDIGNADPLPLEAVDLRWFTAEEMHALKLIPGNARFADGIAALLRANA